MADSSQLLFDLGTKPSLTRDDLMVSTANLGAVSLIDIWPQWQAPYAILTGPKGSGKTHLAEIWRVKADAHRVNPAAFSSQDLDAAQAGKAIVIDDLTFDALDETALFHLMNAVRTSQSTMLITAATHPEFWAIKTPDLVSRIKAAINLTIQEPDDILMSLVISKLFSDRQVNVPASVIQYMVQRMERSLEAANDAVAAIDKLALETKSPVTKPLVSQVIKHLDNEQSDLAF